MIEVAMMETLQRNQAIQQTLNNDIQTIQTANNQINEINGRVLPLLSDSLDRIWVQSRVVAEVVD